MEAKLLKGDYLTCYNEAVQFHTVAQKIISDNLIDNVLQFRYPFAVNIAISCELYLKAIDIYHSQSFLATHDLCALIKRLPAEVQQVIEKNFIDQRADESDVSTFLESQKDVFVEWRYPFELNKSLNTLDVSGFLVFANVLHQYSEILIL